MRVGENIVTLSLTLKSSFLGIVCLFCFIFLCTVKINVKVVNNNFIIIKDQFEQEENKIVTFKTFDKFYKYLDGNLINAQIYDYDFSGIDLKKYNIKNVNIKSEILVKQGLYDDTFYKENVR